MILRKFLVLGSLVIGSVRCQGNLRAPNQERDLVEAEGTTTTEPPIGTNVERSPSLREKENGIRNTRSSNTEYTLKVQFGRSSGDYREGDEVNLVATNIFSNFNQHFAKWLIFKGDPEIVDVFSPTTKLIMPAEDVDIEAMFIDDGTTLPPAAPLFDLDVGNGRGDGQYGGGEQVTITARDRSGRNFTAWVVLIGNPVIEDRNSSLTSLTMPQEDVSVRAVYGDAAPAAPVFALTVENGLGDGGYEEGSEVSIQADCGEDLFEQWTVIPTAILVINGTEITVIDNATLGNTTLTMPPFDLSIVAVCRAKLYKLVVVNGNGDGEYPESEKVVIVGDNPNLGEGRFSKWEIKEGTPVIEDITNRSTNVIMPGEDVIIEASYLYRLIVTDGDGDGIFPVGEIVTVTAGAAAPEMVFYKWVSVIGDISFSDPFNNETNLTIPPKDATVRATYAEFACGSSLSARSETILTLLRTLSGGAVDEDGTPQNLAATWLIETDEMRLCTGENDEKLLQRYTMAVLYYSTEGEDWIECFEGDIQCGTGQNGKTDVDFLGKAAYLSAESECNWAGNTCDSEYRMIKISWGEDNNAGGTIPSELQVLRVLDVFSLESQHIGGTLPSEIGTITTLRILDLDFNQIAGPIPPEYYSLVNLLQLDLNNNQLTGTLPSDIEKWDQLYFMQFQNNKFSGTFPEELASIPLIYGEFYNNDFTGEMPLCIGSPDQTTISLISTDCFPENPKTTCGEGCGCSCY